ncbi:MAG: phosphopantothenoylcysteine decarboxylase, partial [Gemmatimonadota bacterium]|nr:phosphopantothenoylcysteine decarboxylase [Gemmatimonadota bacterium]
PEPDVIADEVERMLRGGSPLTGKRVLVTAGATREPVDPVRFISNYSSGRMGVAVARAAWERGAQVTLVAGSIDVPLPTGAHVIHVRTTEEMSVAVSEAITTADVLIMAAAPADFRPAEAATSKIKKSLSPSAIPLVPTTDILAATIEGRPESLVVIGFALETDNLIENARAKLSAKKLDMIVANRAGPEGEGFGSDTNRVTFISSGGSEELPLISKSEVAELLLDRVEGMLNGR